MMLLLICSAFFSGSETAFFNLSKRQINHLKKSKHRLHKLVSHLVTNPRRLLGTILLGNMTVNVLFYAVASIFTFQLRRQAGVSAAAAAGAATFTLLVLTGEILPKTLAYASPRPFSIIAAMPIYFCIRIFAPIQWIFRLFVVEPALRLFLGPASPPKPISATEFRSLIEASSKKGIITPDENKLMAEIIQLGYLKVRHVLRPRVDMIACDIEQPSNLAQRLMLKNNLTKIPVYSGEVDNIIGMVYLRRILLNPGKSLDKLVEPINFVPEQKTVESLLEHFRKTETDTAVVVDEYGGIAGAVSLEDIASELLGPVEVFEEVSPVRDIGPMQYRISGSLPIHEWADIFRINPVETRISTIGGLVTALLGKVPRPGDQTRLKNLRFNVESVKKRRIETLVITFEPIEQDA